jgi:hypothetical protein
VSEGTLKNSFWYSQNQGQSHVEMELINTAEHTTYENVHVMVTYFDEQGTKLGKEDIAYWPELLPGSNVVFTKLIHPPPLPQRPTEVRITVEGAFAHE